MGGSVRGGAPHLSLAGDHQGPGISIKLMSFSSASIGVREGLDGHPL
jgi:hypothetical protein